MKKSSVPPRHAPSHTQVPNCVFDVILPQLNGVEAKMLFVICRYTFGWQRERCQKTLVELERFTGSCNQSVLESLKTLVESKILTRSKKATGELVYGFNMDFDPELASKIIAAKREKTRIARLAKSGKS